MRRQHFGEDSDKDLVEYYNQYKKSHAEQVHQLNDRKRSVAERQMKGALSEPSTI